MLLEEESGDNTLNLVLLGKDGLATTLNRDIRQCCIDDEFTCGSRMYSLDYRPIDGDVTREQNSLSTANFKPHGKYEHFYLISVYDGDFV